GSALDMQARGYPRPPASRRGPGGARWGTPDRGMLPKAGDLHNVCGGPGGRHGFRSVHFSPMSGGASMPSKSAKTGGRARGVMKPKGADEALPRGGGSQPPAPHE